MHKIWISVLLCALLCAGCKQDGCGKDTDCKGDRVCQAGVCTNPTPIDKPAASPTPATKSVKAEPPKVPAKTVMAASPSTGEPSTSGKAQGITGSITATMGGGSQVFAKGETAKTVQPKPASNLALGHVPLLGPEDAPVKLVLFSDFQCPFSQRLHPILERVMKQFKGSVSLRFKHYPQIHHKEAFIASIAAVCAHEQKKFSAFRNKLFKPGQKLTKKAILKLVARMGLKVSRFKTCVMSPGAAEMVKQDMADAERLGVKGTPFVYINNRPFMPGIGYNDKSFSMAVGRILKGGR